MIEIFLMSHATFISGIPCVLFSKKEVGRSRQAAGKLVATALKNYKDVITDLEKHKQTEHHKRNMEALFQFQKRVLNPSGSIDRAISRENEEQYRKNRDVLESRIRGILFCGRNGLPLRGHKDQGPEILPDGCEQRDGVLRSVWRLMAKSGDHTLHEHMLYGHKNAQYRHHDIQNDIIDIIGKFIGTKILQRVKRAEMFSVIADETTDNSISEQMSITVRYVLDNTIYEDFIEFEQLQKSDLTGKGLADKICHRLASHGLDLKLLVACGFDGASNMSGKFNVSIIYILVL